ncbi:MAG: hypothetical protein ABFE01_08570 [Phycisphaerales bacterium]|jgi:hypothetical protein
MKKQVVKPAEKADKKTYVEPQLKKEQVLQNVTQGETPVVTGAPLPG